MMKYFKHYVRVKPLKQDRSLLKFSKLLCRIITRFSSHHYIIYCYFGIFRRKLVPFSMFISVPLETINEKTLNYLHFKVLIFLDHNLTNKLLLIPKLQFDFEAINFLIYTKFSAAATSLVVITVKRRNSGWLEDIFRYWNRKYERG